MKKWKISDVDKFQKVPPHSRAVKIPKELPKGVQHIKNHLTFLKIPFVQELKFHSIRKFRFDFAIPDLMIAIEYEGLNSEKSGHTTLVGYTEDCVKYNLAAIDGWSILRYTAVNVESLAKDLRELIKSKKK